MRSVFPTRAHCSICPLTHPVAYRVSLKTKAKENPSEVLTLRTSEWTQNWWHSWSITGSFRCFPRQIMKWSRSASNHVSGVTKALSLDSTPLRRRFDPVVMLIWVLKKLSSLATFAAGAACDGGCNCSPDCVALYWCIQATVVETVRSVAGLLSIFAQKGNDGQDNRRLRRLAGCCQKSLNGGAERTALQDSNIKLTCLCQSVLSHYILTLDSFNKTF